MASASTRRRTSSTLRRATSSPRSRRRRARRPAREPIWSSPRTSRRTPSLVRPLDAGGYGLDALWNDDFHHTAMVALTGQREAYYSDYGGTPQEFISSARFGYLYQGQRYSWQTQPPRDAARDLPPSRLRHLSREPRSGGQLRDRQAPAPAHEHPGRYRAMTALLLLGPATPLLFQGQEFASSRAVPLLRRSRAGAGGGGPQGPHRVPVQFPSLADDRVVARACRRRPTPATFERCKLDLRGARAARATATRCTAICWRCVATIRCCRGRHVSAGRGRRRAGALLLRYLDADARRSTADRQPRCRSRLQPGARAADRAAVGGALAPGLEQRGAAATAARGSRRSIPTGPGACPAAARCSSFRSTDERSRTHHSCAARSRGRNDRGGRAPAAPRMAGDQRPRRIRVRHGRRHADAALSRHAGGLAARAARAHGPAQPPAGARAPAGTRRRLARRSRTRSPDRMRRIARSTSRNSVWSSACRSGSIASTGSRSRSGS